ncbi:MAG TPA: hypothetical protein PK528_14070 [Syntrophorhabdus sp.]|nr:hypothetical protein [Syntrophorhabdus sp.]
MLEEKRDIESFLAEIEKVLPPIVFRNWSKWRDVLPMSPRSVANDDCLGIGPKEKVYLGRVAGYPRSSLMAYLKTKTRMPGGRP